MLVQGVTNPLFCKMKRFQSCCCVSRRQSGLRQVDPHATEKLTAGTLNAYRKAVMRFLCYLNFMRYSCGRLTNLMISCTSLSGAVAGPRNHPLKVSLRL